jgi:hypothetical protein
MKNYYNEVLWRNGGIDPPYLTSTLGSEWTASRSYCSTPRGRKFVVSIEEEAEWNPKAVWALWSREGFFCQWRESSPSVQSLVRLYFVLTATNILTAWM